MRGREGKSAARACLVVREEARIDLSFSHTHLKKEGRKGEVEEGGGTGKDKQVGTILKVERLASF